MSYEKKYWEMYCMADKENMALRSYIQDLEKILEKYKYAIENFEDLTKPDE